MSTLRRAAGVTMGLGALGYGYTRAKFRRTTSGGTLVAADPPRPGSPEFGRLVEVLTGAAVRPGNRVQLLRNGAQTFPAMLAAISSAQRTIDFSSYIYWPGDITEQFTAAFAERARKGVEVNLVLDAYGSARLGREHRTRLDAAGVRVCFFRPPGWHRIQNLNNRMHRRLLIVDGVVGFAGGVGIADVWSGDGQDPDHWRETHAQIEGPALRDVLGGFAESWAEAAGEVLTGPRFPALTAVDGGVCVQVTRSSPTAGNTVAAQLFYLAIAGAQERVWLTTAYFSAGRRFLDVLCAAAQRGVDVRVLVNGREVDKEVVRKTGQNSYGPLLEAGVRIFEYDRTMLHAKTLVVDHNWSNIGSSNFDNRSFALDAELNVSLFDAGLTAQLAEHFLEDLQEADEIDLGRWRSRPLGTRVLESVSELARQSF